MPTERVHRNKQNIADRALSHLQVAQNSSQHADWIVTLAFYKALHAVDSYLAKSNIDPLGHAGNRGRNESVRQHLQKIYGQYSALYRASIRARYEDYTYHNKPKEVANLLTMSMQIENYIKTLI